VKVRSGSGEISNWWAKNVVSAYFSLEKFEANWGWLDGIKFIY